MWDDSTNWIDTTDWTDTDELAPVTVTETIIPVAQIDTSKSVTSQAPTFYTVTFGEIAATTEITGAVLAGHALLCVFIVETQGEAVSVKGGTTAGGSDWFAETACRPGDITSITVNKMLSTSADKSMHLTVTSGLRFSIDAYMLTTKIL